MNLRAMAAPMPEVAPVTKTTSLDTSVIFTLPWRLNLRAPVSWRVPGLVVFREGEPLEIASRQRHLRLHLAETPLEFRIRVAERGFRVHTQVPGVVDDREQKVAELRRNRFLVPQLLAFSLLRHGLPEFDELFLYFRDDIVRRGPVEPDPRRAFLQLLRPQQGRESACDVIEDADPASFRAGARLPLPRLVGFPRQRLCFSVRHIVAAEDMGVSADHLVADSGTTPSKSKPPVSRDIWAWENDLKEQIPELVAQTPHITVLDRVHDLVCLFDGVGRDGLEGLLEVPGASAVRIAKFGHDIEKSANVASFGEDVHEAIIEAGPEARNHGPTLVVCGGGNSKCRIMYIIGNKKYLYFKSLG